MKKTVFTGIATALVTPLNQNGVDYDALVRDDFDSYFVDRAKKLLGLIEKAMGKPVSDRDAEITIEQFGASLM